MDTPAHPTPPTGTTLTCHSPHGWDRHTGTLGVWQRWGYARASLASLLRSLGPRGPLGRAGHLAVEDVRLPNTPWVATALARVERFTPPWLMNHCFRTYLWGAALAQRDGLHPDPTLLALCALMHDVALTDAHVPPQGVCFGVHGGRVAGALLEGVVPHDVRQVVMDAVALHLDVSVELRHGVEAHLLNAGAKLDVVGTRMSHVERTTRQAVLAAHPRLGFKACLVDVLRDRAARAPHTRTALLMQLGMARMVQRVPMPD